MNTRTTIVFTSALVVLLGIVVIRTVELTPRAPLPQSVPFLSSASDSLLGAISESDTKAASDHLNSALGAGTLRDEALNASSFIRTGDVAPPALTAHSVLIADITNGSVYFEINGTDRWPMASLTKLMTAAVAIPAITETSIIPFAGSNQSAGDVPDAQTQGVSLQYSVHDMLRMMLVASNNDAAEALANFYGRAHFLETMNHTAIAWDMNNTYFEDASGLSAANQSTAEDLKKLVEHIYTTLPDIFRITNNAKLTVKEAVSLRTEQVTSTNAFAGTVGFLGGKTGYTPEANGNLISLFSYKKTPIVIIVLGSDDRFGETQALLGWFKQNFSLQ